MRSSLPKVRGDAQHAWQHRSIPGSLSREVVPAPCRRPHRRARFARDFHAEPGRRGATKTAIRQGGQNRARSGTLGADDQPRTELFVADGTHFSAKGYAIVAGLIRERM
jgi:hypothetical protein